MVGLHRRRQPMIMPDGMPTDARGARPAGRQRAAFPFQMESRRNRRWKGRAAVFCAFGKVGSFGDMILPCASTCACAHVHGGKHIYFLSNLSILSFDRVKRMKLGCFLTEGCGFDAFRTFPPVEG
jgi:hypothetical protein